MPEPDRGPRGRDVPAFPAGTHTRLSRGARRGASPLVRSRARCRTSRPWLVRGELRLGVEPEETAEGVAVAGCELDEVQVGELVEHVLRAPSRPPHQRSGETGREGRVLDERRSEERRVGKEGRSRWSPYH